MLRCDWITLLLADNLQVVLQKHLYYCVVADPCVRPKTLPLAVIPSGAEGKTAKRFSRGIPCGDEQNAALSTKAPLRKGSRRRRRLR